MYKREIVCLANSRKPPSGRCIAGKEHTGIRAGQWVRPVSSREGKEVSEEERRYSNGRRAEILDIITVPLTRPTPIAHQKENELLDDGHYWSANGRATWALVGSLVDSYDPNFWGYAEDTRYGRNDKVPEASSLIINSSLKLIEPQHLRIQVLMEDGFEDRPSRKRVRAHFNYHDEQYALVVTDPVIEDAYLPQNVGYYPIQNAILCISLAEVWNGYAFRLVASVITPERCGQ